MSSAVVSTSAALGRPFIFDADPDVSPNLSDFSEGQPPQRATLSGLSLNLSSAGNRLASITPASQLHVRPAPEMVSSGISAIDAFTGGLPRGCLTEICGSPSSGRTTVLLAALAAATRRGEFCALIDASDALDPRSLADAGVELDRLLWVRCGEGSPQKSRTTERQSQAAFKFGQTGSRPDEHRLEQLLRATDMLLESGGFGLIALDLCDLPLQTARRIPLTTWFRFRRAVEHTPTALLAIEQQSIAGSCSSLLLKLRSSFNASQLELISRNNAGSATEVEREAPAAKRRKNAAHGASRGPKAEYDEAPGGRKNLGVSAQSAVDSKHLEPPHAHLLTELGITVELLRSRLERKPARSASIAFSSKTAWAG
jgi:hypothetical protein